MSEVQVRQVVPADRAEHERMRSALWPGQDDLDAWYARDDAATLVAAFDGGALCGFVEVGERSVAEGCSSSPVGFIEGWYVDPDRRRQGVGAALMEAAADWARRRGCRELGSDTELDNTLSQDAHRRLGFVEMERLVAYLRPL